MQREQASGKRIRTCMACGMKSSKASLHRIVRTPDGRIEFDPTGRSSGRGAYVCSVKCLEVAMKSRRIDNALKTKVGAEDQERVSRIMREALRDTSE